ncbi:MAG: hypothetical protein IPF94_14760 [Betaproteobacteria bacterium]|nr:hypothetical protein [Betaproteobacteria bacterium]
MLRRHLPAACAALAALAGCATPPPAVPRDWFIFLETGRKTPDDRAAVAAMQRGHIDNFKRLFAEGRLFAAGPMRDPAGRKRGIVTVRAASLAELQGYFQPDEYVREGYMTLNAVPATAQKALNTEGIDASRVEEVRIVQVLRPAGDGAAAARQAFLRGLVGRGVVGAWYTLHEGPVAEVLFARSTDTAALQAAFTGLPGGGEVQVWGQWLSPGVVR